MNPIIETGAATAAAQIFTSLFKLAWPGAPSWALVVASLVFGIGTTVLVSLSTGMVMTTQTIAGDILQGIVAAGAAAGIDRTGEAATIKRTVARMRQQEANVAALREGLGQ